MTEKTKNSRISVRIDPKVKEEATQVLDELGLDLTSAITIYLRQVARDKRLPFVPDAVDPLDRATDISLNEIKTGDYDTFANVDEWWKALNNDED